MDPKKYFRPLKSKKEKEKTNFSNKYHFFQKYKNSYKNSENIQN
jgi:hypothetical protein